MHFTYVKENFNLSKITVLTLFTVKMALSVSVLMVSVVFLLSVSEVISQCPPSSGKTLDVYNNNCIGFYRYLPEV